MEAWIAADPEVLSSYGKGFRAKSLPARENLEEELKPNLQGRLKKATRNTQKGEYAKIKHASKLLEMIDSAKVRTRCPHFSTFTGYLTDRIESA